MEKETRAFMLEFAKQIDQKNELGKLEKILFDNTDSIMQKVDSEEIKDLVVTLERNIMNYMELVKYQYFDYGVTASNIASEVNIDWEPKGLNTLIENYS